MSILRGFTAIVLQCAVLAMPLTSGSIRCDNDAGHAAHMDVAGMSMPGMPMPSDGGNGSSDSHSDCSLPWPPGQCQSMTSCAPSAMSVEQATAVASVVMAHEEPMQKDHGLRSVTRAPEPPPPRA